MLETLNSMHPATYGMIGALLGSIIGAGGTILVTFINKRAETRRHSRELAVKWAIESWRTHFEAMMTSKRGQTIVPVEDYIFHAFLMSDALLSSSPSEEGIILAMNESNEILKRIAKERKKFGVVHA